MKRSAKIQNLNRFAELARLGEVVFHTGDLANLWCITNNGSRRMIVGETMKRDFPSPLWGEGDTKLKRTLYRLLFTMSHKLLLWEIWCYLESSDQCEQCCIDFSGISHLSWFKRRRLSMEMILAALVILIGASVILYIENHRGTKAKHAHWLHYLSGTRNWFLVPETWQ